MILIPRDGQTPALHSIDEDRAGRDSSDRSQRRSAPLYRGVGARSVRHFCRRSVLAFVRSETRASVRSAESAGRAGAAQHAGAALVVLGIAGRDFEAGDRGLSWNGLCGPLSAPASERDDAARPFSVDGSAVARRVRSYSQSHSHVAAPRFGDHGDHAFRSYPPRGDGTFSSAARSSGCGATRRQRMFHAGRRAREYDALSAICRHARAAKKYRPGSGFVASASPRTSYRLSPGGPTARGLSRDCR